ncbi:MAG: hypothetical protein IPH60_16435 [Flavobacteriales bacterium]|nr:hypothetical protein [Flavobacteriales bacterium]
MADLFNSSMGVGQLFLRLYRAKNEAGVQAIMDSHHGLFADGNWKPLGDNKSNFSVVNNQQSNPIAAIIEKVTNSIDATLMKRAYETGVDPKSPEAPRSAGRCREAVLRGSIELGSAAIPTRTGREHSSHC